MSYTPPAELRELVDKLLDSPPLNRAEMKRLEFFLENEQALDYYLYITQQEAFVSEALLYPEARDRNAPSGETMSGFTKAGFAAVAVCAIFFIGLQSASILQDSEQNTSNKAPDEVKDPATLGQFLPQITGMFGVRWADENEGHSIVPNTKNKLHLESGIIELTYPNGVQVVLEGPASFKASGGNGGELNYGRLVASVPPGAEGFEVQYTHGKIVDLGTEFGMDVKENGHADIGVFDGEVELHAPSMDDSEILLITENKALRHLNQAHDNVISIPFDQSKFVRNTPSREFSWETDSLEMKEFEFDVSHLIWRGARYRALFKWMHGYDALEIHQVSLCKNGKPIVINKQFGSTGVHGNTFNNIFELALLDADYSRAKWTIKALVSPKERDPEDTSFEEKVPSSAGIMQLVENMESNSSREAFIGSWAYMHQGRKYVRTFKQDGSMDFVIGKTRVDTEGATWIFEDNTLKLKFPHLKFTEDNVLLDENTLLFVNQPYANAVKIDE